MQWFVILKNRYNFHHARRPDTYPAPPLHVAYTQQGDEAGIGGEAMAMGTRIPIPAECQERTGQAGHRNAQVQNGNIRQRLFLARSRGMQAICPAKDQHRFLARQDRKE